MSDKEGISNGVGGKWTVQQMFLRQLENDCFWTLTLHRIDKRPKCKN